MQSEGINDQAQTASFDSFELLVRGLLELPNSPAVISLQVFGLAYSALSTGGDQCVMLSLSLSLSLSFSLLLSSFVSEDLAADHKWLGFLPIIQALRCRFLL
jgi:hypothetical protein